MLISADGLLIGEICHIEALASGGPRYSSEKASEKTAGIDNLILLCPTHHRLIDSQPFIYTADWLRRAKQIHERNIERAVASSAVKKIDLSQISTISFVDALKLWRENEENDKEEFWQKFFEENPRIIAQAVPNHVVKLGQKCYVGGKSIDNQGGNLVDFIYFTKSSKNVMLVEIKTPGTRLIGSRYRTNAYSISEELTGGMIQVLNYRDELLKNYFSISGQDPAMRFSAFNPQCLVIAGNLARENPNPIQQKSLDLFRSNSSVVTILAFDELFGKVRDLVDIVSQ